MNSEECTERIRLIEQYSRAVTEFNASKSGSSGVESDRAWKALQNHICAHQCGGFKVSGPGHVLELAAIAAIDLILVSNDDRRFVDVNQAAADAFGIPRAEIVGRRIDEFFTGTRDEDVPNAWESFVSAGVQSGICVLNAAGRRREFEYQAKANFAPGLHLGILREWKGES